jgi:hypothetical protein
VTRMWRSACSVLTVTVILAVGSGCELRGKAEPFGKTFYVGGASNLDAFGGGVPDGLRQAGYRGDVENFIWTISFNPLIDQLVTINARARAGLLAGEIERYHRRYPQNDINIIALSAGTGVAVWAIEDLKSARVDNLVLLGSSLSHDYDIRRAMAHLAGNIYVYHSPHDAVLDAVLIVGTIDGKRGVQSVGQVGLKKPPEAADRIINTPWSRQFMRYGWAGGHTDCVNSTFIRDVVAPLILPEPQAQPRAVASRPPTNHRVALAPR